MIDTLRWLFAQATLRWAMRRKSPGEELRSNDWRGFRFYFRVPDDNPMRIAQRRRMAEAAARVNARAKAA